MTSFYNFISLPNLTISPALLVRAEVIE